MMHYRNLHNWTVTPTEAVRLQNELRNKVQITPLKRPVKLVAGSDISFELYSDTVYAGFVVLELPSLKIVARSSAVAEASLPYIPGLLSFREIPALLKAWQRLELKPDVLVCDGQGIAHPRGMGIAAHFGLFADIPTIGAVLRTKDKVNPVFVSPGHLIDLAGSIDVLMKCARGYRIPEPTRQAHLFVNEIRRAAKKEAA